MIKMYILLLTVSFFAACSSFKEKETTIKLENISTLSFDSIVISSPLNHTLAERIEPGAVVSTTFTL